MKKKNRSALEIQGGQIWEVDGSSLEINQVGKTLVHYKRYKGKGRGVPTSLAAISELESYLKKNKAVLLKS